MDCVDGMVKKTTPETTGHKFQFQRTRIYPNIFFLKNGTHLVPDAASDVVSLCRSKTMFLVVQSLVQLSSINIPIGWITVLHIYERSSLRMPYGMVNL